MRRKNKEYWERNEIPETELRDGDGMCRVCRRRTSNRYKDNNGATAVKRHKITTNYTD